MSGSIALAVNVDRAGHCERRHKVGDGKTRRAGAASDAAVAAGLTRSFACGRGVKTAFWPET